MNKKGIDMKISNLIGKRFKEKPSEIKLRSHELLLRGGYIRPVSSGIFSELLPGLKVARNIEKIIRAEMNALGANEISMPLVTPSELWKETGRYQAIDDELLRFKDRNEHEMLLAMTHEETVTSIARSEIGSYKEYPFAIYQFGRKYRDEARPRGGPIRAREFTMKDAYSFHTNQKDLDRCYMKFGKAYNRIFARVGIPEVIAIKSDTGMMGGNIAHEYMLPCPDGEDTIITCDSCDYRANREVAVSKVAVAHGDEKMLPLEKFHSPNAKTIDEVSAMVGAPEIRFAKTVVYKPIAGDSRAIVVMVRGDREVNESKLSKVLKASPEFADDAVFEKSDLVPGYSSGIGIKNARVIVDELVMRESNLITGANEYEYHFKNFNVKRDLPGAEIHDITSVQGDDICKKCGGKIIVSRGIEVGNIFQLGDKYARTMNMTYMDENGVFQTPIMGCYGIGIGRLAASVIEAHNDDRGPVWPVSIAPWPVSLTVIYSKTEDGGMEEKANRLYKRLMARGIDVIFDGRKISAGEKFADMDLLGVPLQFVVSPKTLEQDSVEWKTRATGEKGLVKIEDAVSMAKKWLNDENKKLERVAKKSRGIPAKELKGDK